jgi:hypothetical protein
MGFLSSALKIGESAGSTALRTLNAQLFPKSATKVRQGQAVNDIIGLNAKSPNRYAKPPFPSRKGSPLPPLTGDPRAAVTGAARREELIQKRKALAKKKSPVKGSVTKSVKSPLEGPKSSGVSMVDDLFGMGGAPMGYKYGSRK